MTFPQVRRGFPGYNQNDPDRSVGALQPGSDHLPDETRKGLVAP